MGPELAMVCSYAICNCWMLFLATLNKTRITILYLDNVLLQGSFGGGLAIPMLDIFNKFGDEDKQLVVLMGTSGALGTLFPTPLPWKVTVLPFCVSEIAISGEFVKFIVKNRPTSELYFS